jgi:hypothetical protein
MKNTKALCLNMIVKSEMANLERCLDASYYLLGDR